MKLTNLLYSVLSVPSVDAALIKRQPGYHDYGEIRLSLSATYSSPWDDAGSGAKKDVALWDTTPYEGFGVLGTIAITTHKDIVNSQRATLMAALNPNQPPQDPSKPALVKPLDWTAIWDDKGSGANRDGGVWRPICPDGYVSLGDFGASNYNPPVTVAWCVRKDYAKQGTYNSSPLWTDAGSKAHQDAYLWEILPVANEVTGSESLPLYCGTFRVVTYDDAPNVPAWTLSIPLPRNFTRFEAKVPKITGDTIPSTGDIFDNLQQASAILPLTAFFSPTNATILNNMDNPFGEVARSISWYVEGVWENASAGGVTRTDEIQFGFSSQQSETMQHTVGMTVSAKTGTKITEASISLNYQFTYSSSSSYSEFTNYDQKEEFTVPANYVTVMFCKRIRIDVSLLTGIIMYQGDVLSSSEFHLSGAPLPSK